MQRTPPLPPRSDYPEHLDAANVALSCGVCVHSITKRLKANPPRYGAVKVRSAFLRHAGDPFVRYAPSGAWVVSREGAELLKGEIRPRWAA